MLLKVDLKQHEMEPRTLNRVTRSPVSPTLPADFSMTMEGL